VHLEPVFRRYQLIDPQRRDPADSFPDRRLHLGLCVVRQPAFEIAQDGIPGVATDADDVGKAKLSAVGVLTPLECHIFGIRQPIEAGAVLLRVGIPR